MIDSRKTKFLPAALGVMAMVLFGTVADASPILRLDLKQLLVEAETGSPGSYTPGFAGASHTGRLLVLDDADTNMNIILEATYNMILPVFSFPTPSYSIDSIDAEMTFVNGDITGGDFSIVLNRPDASHDVFSASLVPHTGTISSVSSSYIISANLASISFNHSTFGSIDVSHLSTDPTGTLIQFEYEPDVTYQDVNTRVKLEVTGVPTPHALIAGGPLVMGFIAMARRRRRTRAFG
jgi:hypothetical protein